MRSRERTLVIQVQAVVVARTMNMLVTLMIDIQATSAKQCDRRKKLLKWLKEMEEVAAVELPNDYITIINLIKLKKKVYKS